MAGEFTQILASYAKYILPAFLLGIGLAFILEKFLHPKSLRKILRRVTVEKELLVHALGMISPLSIMSFLPIARELADAGVNPSLLFSFFMAERAYDLQSFPIIASLFGVRFALLNAVAIFLSLVVTAYVIRPHRGIAFKKQKHTVHPPFWRRQINLLLIVCGGILVGAVLRVALPPQLVAVTSGGFVSGVGAAIIAGFVTYLGPIVANYPVAKAFADLGMSQAGVFTFLTVSPICNAVVIMLLAASVGLRHTVKAVATYTFIASALSVSFSWFFLGGA